MWQVEALSMEIKKRAAYVLDFWLKMIVPPAAQICVAYYLWDAIYDTKGVREIGGFTFPSMILYYVVAASLYQMVQPEMGLVLREIYSGTLTKFLFYPISLFQFKFISHLSQVLLVGIQLALSLIGYFALFGYPPGLSVSIASIAMALPAIILAGYLFFIMAASLEIIGFWVESVWGLVVMLQIITSLLGGKLTPLSLFPEWLRVLLEWTPFPYLVSFPTRVFLGEVPGGEYLFGMVISIFWTFVITSIAGLIWKKGSYQYTGTGM